ncbi:MAG: hypothetical protein HN478_14235 [Rhodospirillaceae bacterium]|nr:hypothetical protein [Rhodospirillaceae bacterium]MBT5079809.1 hypothetical protein [Rhodospirillaceae bacterium]MBT5895163.1 hypothetical protein [Rhodospirillaceae bacterium]MBT6429608.1 hypothetical protein [Rhodospirillaceae bacterium]MBT6983600.1 hypothetical protein [Rhodospirillaceae bacterium]
MLTNSKQAVRLNEIAAQHKDRMDFYCIYIQEAHPEDGWQVQHNLDDDIVLNAPTTIEERAEIAEVCVLRLNMEMPMLLDDMTDQADGLYNALPERLYLIDEAGIVRFKTVAGSMGFKPENWANAITELLGVPA